MVMFLAVLWEFNAFHQIGSRERLGKQRLSYGQGGGFFESPVRVVKSAAHISSW